MRSRKTAITFPAARQTDLLVEQLGGESVVYDLKSKEAHCLKPLAAFVFAQADGKTPADEIASRAERQLGVSVSGAEIQDAIAQLDDCALLDTPLVIRDGLSRRDVVRRAGYAGAAAVGGTLITSIVAPTAAMAASGITTGCSGCGGNSDCASNHCCQGNPGKACNQGCCVGKNNSCHFCGCVSGTCNCTVTPSDIGTACPCICGTPGCSGPCCPAGTLCCSNVLPTGCT